VNNLRILAIKKRSSTSKVICFRHHQQT